LQFGVPHDAKRVSLIGPARLSLGPGRLVLILGPSGSGKSTALAQIERQVAGCGSVERVRFAADAATVDLVAPWAPLADALAMMTGCGLGDARLWLRRYEELSEGEKFRARLARGVALTARSHGATPLLCDEFCVRLHRRAARAVCINLHKLVGRHRLCVVVANCDEDVIPALRPDVVVRLSGGGRCTIEEREPRRGDAGRRRLRIEPATKRDYQAFAEMHYRAAGGLGFVDKVFVLREQSRGGDPLGIVVYAYSPLELALRNEATSGRFSGKPALLNRSFRILRRLVIHPDVRGCGLGHYLVRRTLPLVGTEYVECLAAMGALNPVFEKAGMQRIGQCVLSPSRQAALERLRAMNVDPWGREFPLLVSRRPGVRRLVARVVFEWYAATTGGGDERVARQSPEFLARTFQALIASRPVYYLWHGVARETPAHSPNRPRGVTTQHVPSAGSASSGLLPTSPPYDLRRERGSDRAPDGPSSSGGTGRQSPTEPAPETTGSEYLDGSAKSRSRHDPRRRGRRSDAALAPTEPRAAERPRRRARRGRTRHDPRQAGGCAGEE